MTDPAPPIWFLVLSVLVVVLSQYSLTALYHSNASLAGKNATFVVVTDSDHGSRHPDKQLWTSYAQVGTVTRDEEGTFSFELEDELRSLSTPASVKGRSMELSALQYYEEKLLAFCDRSGFIFEVDLVNSTVALQSQLISGAGDTGQFFKSEWVTVKDDALIVGSNGKEWVNSDGVVEHKNLQWVKVIEHGDVRHENWEEQYTSLRESADAAYPGYLIHESGVWDERSGKWLFLPRKLSKQAYNEKSDELLSANTLLIASEDFTDITSVKVGPFERDWGFTDVKVLPASLQSRVHTDPTILMGIKAKEHNGMVDSKFTVFDTTGQILLNTEDEGPFLPLGVARKFEGLAFLPSVFQLSPELEESADEA